MPASSRHKPGYFMNLRLGVTATAYMGVLRGFLGPRPLRRTVYVRLRIEFLQLSSCTTIFAVS